MHVSPRGRGKLRRGVLQPLHLTPERGIVLLQLPHALLQLANIRWDQIRAGLLPLDLPPPPQMVLPRPIRVRGGPRVLRVVGGGFEGRVWPFWWQLLTPGSFLVGVGGPLVPHVLLGLKAGVDIVGGLKRLQAGWVAADLAAVAGFFAAKVVGLKGEVGVAAVKHL